MAQASIWDINRYNAGFWNIHMTLQALMWLKSRSVYDPESMNKAIKQLLNKTNLVEYYETFTETKCPDDFFERSQIVMRRFETITVYVDNFINCLLAVQKKDNIMVSKTRSIRELQEFWKAYEAAKIDDDHESNDSKGQVDTTSATTGFPNDILELYLEYCDMFYSFGHHAECKLRLKQYLEQICEFVTNARDNSELKIKCLWGLLASMIVTLPQPQNIRQDETSSDGSTFSPTDDLHQIPTYILTLNDLVDSSKMTHQQILLSKLWLFQWSVWLLLRYYFTKLLVAGPLSAQTIQRTQHFAGFQEWNRLIDWVFSDQILTLVSVVCPRLMRYIAVLTVLNRQRQDLFKAAIDTISRDNSSTNSTFTNILDCLFVKFDFQKAEEQLARCREEAAADYLLEPLKDVIEEDVRLLIFQTNCRIQKSIDIDSIARKLHISPEGIDKWIVSLIRSARLEGRIDPEKKRLEIASASTSVHQQVSERCNKILNRMDAVIQNLNTNTKNYSQTIGRQKESSYKSAIPQAT